MNNQTKTLVPKLRFSEFRNAPEWEVKPIAKVCDVLNSRRMPISSDNREKGYYPYYGASGIVDYVKDFIFDERLLLVGEDGAKWGAFEKTAFIAEGMYWVNNHAHVLRTTTINDTLLENYLSMLDLTPFITGAAPPKLTLGKLKDIPIPIPPTEKEQQKIADCLSSIDKLITAQTQKLDTLKTHKKGLMQQLFPAEGEAVPKLRFPEFRDAREWEEKRFGNLLKISSGKGFTASEYSNAGIRLLQIENVGYGKTKWNENTTYLPENYIQKHPELVLRENDIVLALNRPITNDNLKIAKLEKLDEPSMLYQRVGRVDKISNSIVNSFIFHICQKFVKNFVMRQSIGSDQPFISLKGLYDQTLLIPSPHEQEKIADCLASVDALIAAQAQKIEALKQHKKGLMQQLFPAADEVAG